MKIIYIHGYGSIPEKTKKGKLLIKKYGKENVFIPDYTNHGLITPEDYYDTLKFILYNILTYSDYNKNEKTIIIGSSLGGLLADNISHWLENKKLLHDVSTVLINPLVDIKNSLLKDKLTHFPYEQRVHSIPLCVLLETGDEVLDYTIAEEKYKYLGKVITFKGGNHRFTNTKKLLNEIDTISNVIYL